MSGIRSRSQSRNRQQINCYPNDSKTDWPWMIGCAHGLSGRTSPSQSRRCANDCPTHFIPVLPGDPSSLVKHFRDLILSFQSKTFPASWTICRWALARVMRWRTIKLIWLNMNLWIINGYQFLILNANADLWYLPIISDDSGHRSHPASV